MIDIEKRIASLERKATKLGLSSRSHGTQIVRLLADRAFLASRNMKLPRDQECALIWSVGIGGIQLPKLFYYGETIAEALRRAEHGVAAIAKTRRP